MSLSFMSFNICTHEILAQTNDMFNKKSGPLHQKYNDHLEFVTIPTHRALKYSVTHRKLQHLYPS